MVLNQSVALKQHNQPSQYSSQNVPPSFTMSVRPHVTARQQSEGYSRNFVPDSCSRIYPKYRNSAQNWTRITCISMTISSVSRQTIIVTKRLWTKFTSKSRDTSRVQNMFLAGVAVGEVMKPISVHTPYWLSCGRCCSSLLIGHSSSHSRLGKGERERRR
jgi:hypothetical protein